MHFPCRMLANPWGEIFRQQGVGPILHKLSSILFLAIRSLQHHVVLCAVDIGVVGMRTQRPGPGHGAVVRSNCFLSAKHQAVVVHQHQFTGTKFNQMLTSQVHFTHVLVPPDGCVNCTKNLKNVEQNPTTDSVFFISSSFFSWCFTSTESIRLFNNIRDRRMEVVEEGGRRKIYCYTDTTKMTPALRCSVMRAILMFH